MSIETDTRDRLIVVENEVKHVNEKLDELGVMVRAQHDVFMQAKGARWVIWTAAGVFGFVAGVVGWVVPWLYSR